MAAYFFASPVDVEIKLEGEDERKKIDLKTEKEKVVTAPVYYDGESVAGQVRPRAHAICAHLNCSVTGRCLYASGTARSLHTTGSKSNSWVA